MGTERPIWSFVIRVTLEQEDSWNFSTASPLTIPVRSSTTAIDGVVSMIQPGLRWSSLLLAAFMLWGAAGNALVCIAIFTDRRLQNVTNYFLFSLAIADLLVSLIVMPFSILTELHDGYWHYGFNVCAAYSYADVFLCSASIVHMSIISLDRYLGISRPLKTRNKSKLVVTLKIICVWVITTMISCPIAILAIVSPRDIYHERVCSIDNQYFLIYGSTLSFLIPCVIMVATYIRTTQLLRQQALLCTSINGSSRSLDTGIGNGNAVALRRTRTRPIRSSAERPKIKSRKRNSNSDSRSPTSRRNSPSYVSTSEMCLRPPSWLNRASSVSPDENSRNIETERNDRLRVALPKLSRASKCSDDCLGGNVDPIEDHPRFIENENQERKLKVKIRERTLTFWNKTTRRASSATELANEQKATRVLGLVFGCFIICWTPFFLQNFTLAFCGQNCHMPHWLTSMFLWLGYLSSTINPIIYTTFNKRFRQAFANILRCRCCIGRRQKPLRSHASGSSFYSVNNNYHGYLTSTGGAGSLAIGPTLAVNSLGKCNMTSRTPPDLIATAANDSVVIVPILRS